MSPPRAFLVAAIATCAMVAAFASSAQASFNVIQNFEPAYTKGATNTWWFNWSQDTTAYPQRICYSEYINSVSQGYEADGCVAASGSGYRSKVHTGLTSGSSYMECAMDQSFGLVTAGVWTDNGGSSPCWQTTMDNSAPSNVYTGVDGTATSTNDPVMNIDVHYQDSISPPWFYSQGSTFDCWRKNADTAGTPCQNANPPSTTFQADPGCSSPTSNHNATSTWSCTYDIRQLNNYSDGTWYYCVKEADSAFPDNSSTQNPSATPSQANVSPDTPANCGYVTLDTSSGVGGGSGGSGGASGTTAGGSASTPATGQRAAALKKCKHKHGRARAKCKKKANLLPV
jgi:hypothetical protein